MEYENFKLEIDEQGTVLFTADRSERINTFNDKSWAEINDFFLWADQLDEVKVVIITETGSKAFIADVDLNSLRVEKPTDCLGGTGQKALNKTQKCPKPVIATVNGYAFRGGCGTAIACDFRAVSENALFALPETGLDTLSGAGGTQGLSRLIGPGRATDIILIGRKIGAGEAVEIELAIKCVPQWELLLEVKKMVGKPTAREPVTLRVTKQVVIVSLPSSQEIGGPLEILALSTLYGTRDRMEGVFSLLGKRTSDYKGE